MSASAVSRHWRDPGAWRLVVALLLAVVTLFVLVYPAVYVLVGSFSPARLREFRRLTGGRVPTSAGPLDVVLFRFLQENGYFVLRFLVEDVGKELDAVLDAILRVLARRRQSAARVEHLKLVR